MMDTTTSRAEFEKWASQKFGLPLKFIVGQRFSSGYGYYTGYLNIAYQDWKEIRGSIVVEIPYASSALDFMQDVPVVEVSKLASILRSAGLTVKGE
ncbi:hypothetical protein [Yersinia rohdei]|uniref:Uncharacterized protein n=1 Tax=Yersinia rohdei TaxID=29485 RepID=A0A0U1HQV7_YERRO|nr:hypothetical protein [Yersinia rohdei]CQI88933.1 Uncharacterised protein [Yersinia rohdei]